MSAKTRVLPPVGGIFRISMDLRDGKEYLTDVSMGDCPFKRFHVQMREQGKTCFVCNGKDYILRFEEMRTIKAVEGGPVGDVRVQSRSAVPMAKSSHRPSTPGAATILKKARENQSPDSNKVTPLQKRTRGPGDDPGPETSGDPS